MSDPDKLFLITGATGNTGAHTVRLLREGGRRVRALVHSIDERAERLLDRSALMTTHRRPTFFTFFMNMFWIRENDGGVYRLPFADGRHAPIDAADQAHVIAAILQNPEPHDRQIYQLSGAEDLTWHEIAAKVQATLAISVRYEPMDIPAFGAGLAEAGASPHFVQHFSNVAQDYRDGVFAGANDLVEVIGGVKPITVEDYVESTRSLFDTTGRPRR